MKSIFPDGILSQHIAVLGKTRSGKTNSAKLLIEQVAAAGSRVCVIDPIKSDYWGLTSSANGKQPGLPFHIIGGTHGHVPLHASAGAAVAEVVATGALRLSIVDMEAFGPRESGPFFAAFMETIFRRIVGVLYIVIDEAHLFAPKEGRGGDESMATYWFKRMASGSGSKGVRLVVSTQRVQELHNTVLSNCDTVIAHRVTFPEDQKRISDWVASHATKEVLAEVKRSLPNLNRGEAWMCSGEEGFFERRQMPLCSTYDNSRTPTEDDKRAEVKMAEIDQEALRSIIGEAVKEAEANDPKKFKARVAELESEIERGKAAPVEVPQRLLDAVRAKAAEEGGLQVAQRISERASTIAARLEEDIAALQELQEKLKDDHHDLVELCRIATTTKIDIKASDELRSIRADSGGFRIDRSIPIRTITIEPDGKVLHQQNGHIHIAKDARITTLRSTVQAPHQKILNAVAWWKAAGIQTPLRVQVAVAAGYTVTGGTFGRYISTLSSEGLISYPDAGSIDLTPDGAAMVESPESAPSLAHLHDRVRGILENPHCKILDVLLAAGGREMGRTELAERAGYEASGGTFGRYISHLSGLKIVRYPKKTTIAAAAWLFPEGLS